MGLYTIAEAGWLVGVGQTRLARWLRGHRVKDRSYEPLWRPEVDIGDGGLYLSFRDLLEAHVASKFIATGLSPQKVRQAIRLATDIVGERPLSTEWLRTDGRAIFLRVLTEAGDEPKLLNLFSKQYAFNAIVQTSFRDIEFLKQTPAIWWPRGRRSGILIDPARSFGQPIERETSIPAKALAMAAVAEDSPQAAAKVWDVPLAAVRRAIRFYDAGTDWKAA